MSIRLAGVLPLRPLTVGELLDAAVVLLRERAGTLLAAGFLLAAVEQAVLFPLRQPLAFEAPFYLPFADQVGRFWLVFALGFGTEAAILAMLGALAAAVAGPGLLGVAVPAGQVWRSFVRRLPAIVTVAALVGLIAGMSALAAGLPWLFVYGLLGPATPALVVERRGPFGAIGRGLTLSARIALRAAWIRLLGYLAWLAIRVALSYGAVAVVKLAAPGTDDEVVLFGTVAGWLVVNAVAYPMLACLDAVLYLETRMRTEALDIAIGRAVRRGPGAAVDLAAVR